MNRDKQAKLDYWRDGLGRNEAALNDEQKRVCPIAKQTEETMLAAPCDQRYTAADMQDIGQQIDNVIRATCR